MALKDIQIPTVDVPVAPGSSFAVRGLSTTDIEFLIRKHGESLRQLFTQYVNGDALANLNLTDLTPVLKDVVGKVPGLVIDAIALAADADEQDLAQLKKLSAGIHIAALGAIFSLTLTTEGDMGKALEAVIKVLGNLNGGMGEMLKEAAKP